MLCFPQNSWLNSVNDYWYDNHKNEGVINTFDLDSSPNTLEFLLNNKINFYDTYLKIPTILNILNGDPESDIPALLPELQSIILRIIIFD